MEISSGLTREIFDEYCRLDPAVIRWVFRQHRKRSSFWPTIHEIEELREEYGRVADMARREAEDKTRDEENRQTREKLEASGQPAGLAQLAGHLRKIAEAAKVMTIETDPIKRQAQIKKQLAEVRARKAQ